MGPVKHIHIGTAVVFAVCFCILADIAHATPGDRFYVQEDDTNLHESPSAAAPIAIRLKRGDRVIEFRRQGSWVRVNLLGSVGKDGWIDISRLGSKPPNGGGGAAESIVGVIDTPPDANAESNDLKTFELKVTGRPARQFEGRCRIITASGSVVRRNIGGVVPKAYKTKGLGVRCNTWSADPIRAVLTTLDEDGSELDKMAVQHRTAIVHSNWNLD